MLILSEEMFLHAVAWAVNILFWGGLVPQVILNYRLKTARGLSDVMLWGYFNGYIAYVYYAFCCNLPLAYRVVVPLCFVTMLLMVVQRFVYDGAYQKDKKLLVFYILNAVAAILILPQAFKQAWFIGSIAGWIEITIWALYQIPQVFKIHVNKSVVGFSFALVTLVGIGDIIELIVAITLRMPLQTIVNDLRGIVIYLIFCVQFWLYNQRDTQCLIAKN